MTTQTDHLPGRQSLLDIVERASLFALLQQALTQQKHPQVLPPRLYADLNYMPDEPADFTPQAR